MSAGRIVTGPVGTFLEGRAGSQQDNYMAVPYPTDITLRRSGLAETGTFTPTTNAATPTDQLLVFDPSGTGIDRTPSATYFYYNGGWRKVGATTGTDFADTTTLTAGQGFIIRKASGGTTSAWVFETGL